MRYCLGCTTPLDERGALTHVWTWRISQDALQAARRSETMFDLCAACGEEFEQIVRRYLGLDVPDAQGRETPLRTEHDVPLELPASLRRLRSRAYGSSLAGAIRALPGEIERGGVLETEGED